MSAHETNATTAAAAASSSSHELNYFALVLLLIPLATLFGNVMVIASVLRVRALRSAINYLIMALAFADCMVAIAVMPYAVYVEVNSSVWHLGNLLCDIYCASDVACSTASILTLTVISFDRYRAVNRPIQYQQQAKNTRRVVVIIAAVWFISLATASPVVLGLNRRPADALLDECRFYNADFSIFSSIISFCIPVAIVLFVYVRILVALRLRERQARRRRKPAAARLDNACKTATDAAVFRQKPSLGTSFLDTHRSSFDTIGTDEEDSVLICISDLKPKLTPNHSGPVAAAPTTSHSAPGRAAVEEGSPSTSSSSSVPTRTQFTLTTETLNSTATCPPTVEEELEVTFSQPEDVNYIDNDADAFAEIARLTFSPPLDRRREAHAPLAMVESMLASTLISPETSQCAPRVRESLSVPKQKVSRVDSLPPSMRLQLRRCKSADSPDESSLSDAATATQRSRLDTITKSIRLLLTDTRWLNVSLAASSPAMKMARRAFRAGSGSIRRKAVKSQRKERKATKTLGIVVATFLICWLPFFTLNVKNAICLKLHIKECQVGFLPFFVTTWLGYMNSFMNPIIYTIYNTEFRRAFKLILCSWRNAAQPSSSRL